MTDTVAPVLAGSAPKRVGLLYVLRNRVFMTFSLSQAVSFFGDKLDYMALLAMVAYFSREYGWEGARTLSLVSTVTAMPVVLFGPIAGVLVDRWDRRKVMIVCDIARALLVALIPLAVIRTHSIVSVYAMTFAVFTFSVFFSCSRMSVIPNLVGAENVLGANSFINFIGRIATFAGVFFGGLIVDWAGWKHIGIDYRYRWSAGFYIDALTYAASVVVLCVIYNRLSLLRRETGTGPDRGVAKIRSLVRQWTGRVLAEIGEAWKLVGREPAVLFAYAATVTFVAVAAAVTVLYIPLIQINTTQHGLGMGTRGVGLLGGIAAVGLLISAVGFGAIGHRVRKHKVMLACVLVTGGVTAVLALSHSIPLAAVLAFVAGLAISPIFIGTDTLLHEVVPEQSRGRIFSNRDWLTYLTFAVTAFLAGQLTNFVPSRALLLVIGLVAVVASMAGFVLTARPRIG